MVINKLKTLIRKIRYGGIFDIMTNQTEKINDLMKTNVDLYNAAFDIKHGKAKKADQSIYHGPMSRLKNCRVLKAGKPTKKWQKDMIEVAEFNGYNSGVYYWYFAIEAKIILDDIDSPPEVVSEGEMFITKKVSGKKAHANKAVEPDSILKPESMVDERKFKMRN